MATQDQKDKLEDQDRACIAPELIREYISVRHRLDAAEAIVNESFAFRAEAEAKIKALETVEGALRSVVDTQKARIGHFMTEARKYTNLVYSHLEKIPHFMIVSVTDRGDLQVHGDCPTPADLHRHSGYYFDHPQIKEVALYAKIEFPFEDEDTMAVMCPEPMKAKLKVELSKEQREGDTMSEEKTEEASQEVTEEPTEKPGEEEITIEIDEVDPGAAGIADDWEDQLDAYTQVMTACYDRALTVCIMPEIAGKMALAMYNSIAGGQNAAYREFLDGMKEYLEKLNEPPPRLEPIGPPFGFAVTDFPGFEKPSEERQHEGVEYSKYAVLTEYPNGDHHASFYHEGFGPPGAGKAQAIQVYREARDHPSSRRSYLLLNISDEVPSEDDIEKRANIGPAVEVSKTVFTDEEPPAKSRSGESK